MEEMKERMRQQAELRKRMDLERQQQEQLQQQQATDAAMMAAAVSSPVRQPHTVATSSPLRLHLVCLSASSACHRRSPNSASLHLLPTIPVPFS